MAVLITATGKQLDCTFFGVAQQYALMTKVSGIDFVQAYQIFSNQDETKEITYRDEINGQTADRVERGFTAFQGIDVQPDGTLMVTLTRKLAEV